MVYGTWSWCAGETNYKSQMTNHRWQHDRVSQVELFALFVLVCCGRTVNSMSTTDAPVTGDQESALAEHDPGLTGFQVIEFRYLVKPEERQHFAQYFEAYFPEAFQQLGAIAAGSRSSIRGANHQPLLLARANCRRLPPPYLRRPSQP